MNSLYYSKFYLFAGLFAAMVLFVESQDLKWFYTIACFISTIMGLGYHVEYAIEKNK